MGGISPDAVLGAGITVLLAGTAALWKLATDMAKLKGQQTREFTHNGGSSLKDMTKTAAVQAKSAAEDARIARLVAEKTHDEFVSQAALWAQDQMRIVTDMTGRISRIAEELEHHVGLVRQKEGETGEQLNQLRHDVKNIRLLIELINQDRLRKEREWTDVMRAQGLTTPEPTGIRTERTDGVDGSLG